MRMNKYKKRNFILTALSLFFMSCVIFGCTLFNTGSADALKNVPTSTSVSAIYNFNDYCYNKSALDELANQILTEQAPSYQKTISGLISYAQSNAGRAGKPITNKDITVKYGRYRFTETSTTYNDLVWLPVYVSSNSSGEAILTLYLAGTETLRGTSQQEQGFFTMQGLYSSDPNIAGPSNSYGTSHMRSISLGASKYDETEKKYKTQPYATYSGGTYRLKEDPEITQANCNKFSDFITGKDFTGAFYEDLASPSEMSWQATESFATHSSSFIANGMSSGYANYCWPNEAYGTPAAGDYYLPGYFNYAQKNKTQYNAWQNDKVWLPSLTEVGNGDKNPSGGDTTNGIWKLTANQRSNKQASWLRTAKTDSQKTTDTYNNKYSTYTMFCLNTEGGISESDVSVQCAIRPAIHLNLTKIAAKTTPAVKLPDVVTSIYNGNSLGQTIADIPDDQKTWYTKDDMEIAFYTDKECTRGIAPVDAGTYYMMVTLKGTSNRRFFGESANTMYKSTVFVIQKKKLDVRWIYNTDSTVKSVEYADESVFEDRDKDNKPQLGFYYKSVMNAGDIYYSYPDVMGSYRAYAYILDEQMFRYNYELVENARSNQFTVGRRVLPLPEFCYNEGSNDKISADHRTMDMSYKGKNFVQIKNVSSKMKISVTANVPAALDKLVDLGLNEEKGVQTYMVEDVALYTFTVTLTDKEAANAKWASSIGEAADVGAQSLVLSINPAIITATFDGLLSSWDTMTDMSFTLGIVGVQPGDSVAMRVYYQPARGGNETVLTPDSNGKYTIPKGRNVGEYTIGAVIDGNGQYTTSYRMEQAYTQKFTVTQANSSFGQDLVSWQYTINGSVTRLNEIGAGNTASNPVELDFKDDYYQFTLQMEEGRLQQYYYVKAEYSGDTYVKDAGTHSVTVTISAYDQNVSFATQTYFVYFKIKKTAFNMNGVSWDYPGAYQQVSGKDYEVLLKNVPDGLTVNYSGNKASATGTYTAEAKFVVSDGYAINYDAPESLTLSWEIVASGGVVLSKGDYDTSNVKLLYIHGNKTVTASWNSQQKKWFDSNGKEFVLSFPYDGQEHMLDLEGYGPDFTIGTNHVNNKYVNAGHYTARFDYSNTGGNSAAYNDLEFANLGWTITKAEINFDNVRWGYIVGDNEYDIDFEVNPFTFTRDENGPVKFTVGLINLPHGVTINYSTTCLTKPGTAAVNGNSFSETGEYRTSFNRNITFTDPDILANYVPVNAIPTFIPSFQYWSIEDRKFTKPSYDGSWEEFDARTHDLIDLCNMPRDELPYFRVEIVFLDGGSDLDNYYEGYDGVKYAAYHAGTYIVRFYELRGDAGTEYAWGSVEIVVGKEKLQVIWDSKGSIPVARVTGLYVTEMIGTKYTTASDVEVKEQYIKTTDGVTFYAEPYLMPEYQNDIEIVMGAGQNSPLEFTYWYYQSTPSSHKVDKDLVRFRYDKIEYDGTAKTFELTYWNELSPYLYYEGDSLTQTAVGKYSIDVGFIKYDSVTKAGDAYWLGTDDDRSSVKLTFEITEPTKIALEYPKLESASATYDGNFHRISIVNLAAMNSYVTYEVTYEGMNFGQQLTHKAAGNYTITFSFPEGSIGYWKADTANPKKSYTLTYRIIDPASTTPLNLPKLVESSMEETGGPITFEILNWESYYNGYCTISEGSLTQTSPGTYTVTVAIKDEFPDLKFTNGARWYILTFTITEGESGGMPSKLALPVVSRSVREYIGAEMSFIDNWGYLSKYVTIVGLDGGLIGQGSYIQEELGDYSFYLRIKDEYREILPWADDTTTDKLITFSIVPAKVDVSKLGAGADGKVTAPNQDGQDVDFDDYFEYKYFDKDGKEVSADELADGEEYTVVVSLKNDPAVQAKFDKAFENADEIRQALTTNNSFTFTYDSGEEDNKMLLIIIIAEVAVVVFLMIATGVVLAIQHKVYDTVDDEYDSYDDYEEDD